MKKIKYSILSLVLVLSLLLCSCQNISIKGNETLIMPPVLFEGQDEIIKALYSSVGSNIVLEYPKKGENRSAFLLCDVDGDKENEVVSFYRPVGEDIKQDVIHINVLKNTEEGWSSLCDIIGEAAAIDSVSVGNFSGRKEIIIGWELMRDREKTLVCYSLFGKTLVRDYTATYVEFSVADFWAENEGDEIITANISQTTENLTRPTQHARLICVKDKAFSVVSTTPLDTRVTGYKGCSAGKYNENSAALFLDGLISAAVVNTQILTVNKNGQIKNPLLIGDKTDESNVHKATMLTQDIDGDGILEVPHQEAVTGYEEVPESEKLYKTVWKSLSNGKLVKSKVMYISSLGIRITIPSRMDGNVTIKSVSAQNELKFYEFEGDLTQSTKELFSIRISEKEQYTAQAGYDILKSTDYTVVAVHIADGENELCPTWETLYNIIEIV